MIVIDEKRQIECSTLVYLLDAIRVCPKQYKKLVSLARHKDYSEWYNSMLDRLDTASPNTILKVHEVLRNELR